MQDTDTTIILHKLVCQIERLDKRLATVESANVALRALIMRQREASLVSLAGAEDFLGIERTKPRKG